VLKTSMRSWIMDAPLRRTPFALAAALFLAGTHAWAQGQGQPVGPEFRVNTYTTQRQYAPSVASDGSGGFVVVWTSFGQDGSYFGVFGRRYDAGGTPLGPEFQVNTYTPSSQAGPRVASSPSGDFVVVWASESHVEDADWGVFGQRYNGSGAPLGPEFRVNTSTTGFQGNASVTVAPSGAFVVVWESHVPSSAPGDVLGQRYASSGIPLGPEFRVNTSTPDDQGAPRVASDAAGNFVVVWYTDNQYTTNSDVLGQRFDAAGGPLGPEFRVNTYTTQFQASQSVAFDTSGNFIVTWESYGQDGSHFGVFAQRYASSGAPLGPEFRVNSYTPLEQSTPWVAVDASGSFVIAWNSRYHDGSGQGVFGQRYDGSGAPLGSEFRVNAYTTSNQGYPSVAANASGEFVVVWQSYEQDGSSLGVFGQRYGDYPDPDDFYWSGAASGDPRWSTDANWIVYAGGGGGGANDPGQDGTTDTALFAPTDPLSPGGVVVLPGENASAVIDADRTIGFLYRISPYPGDIRVDDGVTLTLTGDARVGGDPFQAGYFNGPGSFVVGGTVSAPGKDIVVLSSTMTIGNAWAGGAAVVTVGDLRLQGASIVSVLASGSAISGQVSLEHPWCVFRIPADVTLSLDGNVAITGGGLIVAGTLAADGHQVQMLPGASAILGVAGSAGTITASIVATGGTVWAGSPGQLNTRDLSLLSGSTLKVSIRGSVPGSEYDQLRVQGGVTLGATLQLLDEANMPAGTTLTIIDNDGSDPVVGTFDALPEGTTIPLGNSLFRISYGGGDGNDVTLTELVPVGLQGFDVH
jgi:hypothetical protein